MSPIQATKMSYYRWFVCGMLFFAVMINYMDRQVLSLTWKGYIAPVFAWHDDDYGRITALFALAYALGMLFAGRIVDAIGVKKGLAWAIGIWSLGAIMHAFCGIITAGVLTDTWLLSFDGSVETLHDFAVAGLPITTVSIYAFLSCRLVLAIGQAGNFPAANRATADYFPKKDRAFATSIFNNGASVGAIVAPAAIPLIANRWGWEMSFIIVGAAGYVWMLIWLLTYIAPQRNKRVSPAEYTYIMQDDETLVDASDKAKDTRKVGLLKCLAYRQTWALIIAKLLSDCVWWFFLFWTPVYISDFYGYSSDSPMGIGLIMVLYLVSLLSVAGGYMPTYFVNRYRLTPYQGHLRCMLFCALIQLVGFFSIPLGALTPWFFVAIIGFQGASHQTWSANIFSMVGDFFPKKSIGTVTGVIGMAGSLGTCLTMTVSGNLFTYAEQMGSSFAFLTYTGKQAAYMIVFCIFAVLYLLGWGIMRAILPEEGSNNSITALK